MENILIRPYRKEDRNSVRQIAWETAFMGECGSIFFADAELLKDFLINCFTDYEPQSCFVAEVDGKVSGYLIGSKDIRRLMRACQPGLTIRLFIKLIISGAVFKKKNFMFLFSCLAGSLRGEFNMPDFSREYPATLHINLKTGFRHSGIGSRLIANYLDYLSKNNITGVYLATMSQSAGLFFNKSGFQLLGSYPRSYFRHILHKDIIVYIYGKKILT